MGNKVAVAASDLTFTSFKTLIKPCSQSITKQHVLADGNSTQPICVSLQEKQVLCPNPKHQRSNICHCPDSHNTLKCSHTPHYMHPGDTRNLLWYPSKVWVVPNLSWQTASQLQQPECTSTALQKCQRPTDSRFNTALVLNALDLGAALLLDVF